MVLGKLLANVRNQKERAKKEKKKNEEESVVD
jgi:hypothetical protein